jgi:uncharacterized Zn-finger protein
MLEHVRRLLSEDLTQRRETIKRKATHKCDVCGACFYYPAKLREHANIHAGVNPFECDVPGCGATFPTKDRLRNHAQKHAPKHACDLCGMRFQTDAIRRKHMLTHSALRPHACGHPGCGKRFKTATALDGHARTHTGEKPYRCAVEGCEKAYGEATQLSRHRLKVHGIRIRARHSKRQKTTGEFEGMSRLDDDDDDGGGGGAGGGREESPEDGQTAVAVGLAVSPV